MKRFLVASVLGGLLLLGTPTLASSAQRHDSGDHGGHRDNGHRGDHRGDDSNRRDHGRYDRGRYGYSDGYYYGDPQDCYHDSSGYTTCEEYGGDYDPGRYNYRLPRNASYCDEPRGAHSARCEDDPAGENNGVPPGTVVIRELSFNPADIHSRVGEDVVWHFDDKGVEHTATADDGSFDSGKQKEGEFTHAFAEPGTYGYHCSIHPEMKGTVTVGR
jgi:plastocyanin